MVRRLGFELRRDADERIEPAHRRRRTLGNQRIRQHDQRAAVLKTAQRRGAGQRRKRIGVTRRIGRIEPAERILRRKALRVAHGGLARRIERAVAFAERVAGNRPQHERRNVVRTQLRGAVRHFKRTLPVPVRTAVGAVLQTLLRRGRAAPGGKKQQRRTGRPAENQIPFFHSHHPLKFKKILNRASATR